MDAPALHRLYCAQAKLKRPAERPAQHACMKSVKACISAVHARLLRLGAAAQSLEPFYEKFDPEFTNIRKIVREVLQKEDDLNEIVQLVGKARPLPSRLMLYMPSCTRMSPWSLLCIYICCNLQAKLQAFRCQ